MAQTIMCDQGCADTPADVLVTWLGDGQAGGYCMAHFAGFVRETTEQLAAAGAYGDPAETPQDAAVAAEASGSVSDTGPGDETPPAPAQGPQSEADDDTPQPEQAADDGDEAEAARAGATEPVA